MKQKMWETHFNSCEVILSQEKCGLFQPSGCVNRSLAIYITQAVTGHNKHERKPKVRWHCKTKIKVPAVADRQTDRWTDTACCTCVRFWMGLPPFSTTLKYLRSHLELLEVKPPLKIMGLALTNYVWNYVNCWGFFIIFLFVSVTGVLFYPNSVF